jgi:hypothetical protein
VAVICYSAWYLKPNRFSLVFPLKSKTGVAVSTLFDYFQAAMLILVLLLGDMIFFGIAVNLKSDIGIDHPAYIHLFLFLLLFFMIILPIPFFFHHTRKYLAAAILKIVQTPFVDVTFEHFFIADQLTSSSIVFLDLQYALVFYMSGSYLSSGTPTFSTLSSYQNFSFFLALLPYWFRFGQCLRRAVKNKPASLHLWNSFKYFLSILATIFSYTFRFYGCKF